MEPKPGPSNKNAAISYTTSQRGWPIIIYENRRFRKFKNYKGGSVLWRCLDNSCHGFLTINGNEDIIKMREHSCQIQNSGDVQVKEAIKDLYKEAESTDEPIPTMYKNKANILKDRGINLAANLPNFQNIKSSLYRKRNKVHGVDRLFARSAGDVQVPKKYLDFLLADYDDGGRSRILLFATQKSKAELSRTHHLYCDGTFKCAPKPFLQIYSMHREIDGVVKPLAYALLLDKKMTTYITLFQLLKSTVPGICVDVFTSDFEEAAVRGVEAVFPNVAVYGCYFHFKKALKKKGKELGLNENSICRKHVALCTQLPHLPPEAIDDAWLYIMSESPQDDNIIKFNDYMITQWIDHRLWSNKWSCYGQTHKTNNFLESHYSTLNKIINKNNGKNLAKILGVLQQNCNNYSEIRKKMGKSKCQKDAKRRNQLIISIVEEYESGLITIGHCLEKLRF